MSPKSSQQTKLEEQDSVTLTLRTQREVGKQYQYEKEWKIKLT